MDVESRKKEIIDDFVQVVKNSNYPEHYKKFIVAICSKLKGEKLGRYCWRYNESGVELIDIFHENVIGTFENMPNAATQVEHITSSIGYLYYTKFSNSEMVYIRCPVCDTSMLARYFHNKGESCSECTPEPIILKNNDIKK